MTRIGIRGQTTLELLVSHSQTTFFLLYWGGPNIKENKWSGYARLLSYPSSGQDDSETELVPEGPSYPLNSKRVNTVQ